MHYGFSLFGSGYLACGNQKNALSILKILVLNFHTCDIVLICCGYKTLILAIGFVHGSSSWLSSVGVEAVWRPAGQWALHPLLPMGAPIAPEHTLLSLKSDSDSGAALGSFPDALFPARGSDICLKHCVNCSPRSCSCHSWAPPPSGQCPSACTDASAPAWVLVGAGLPGQPLTLRVS